MRYRAARDSRLFNFAISWSVPGPRKMSLDRALYLAQECARCLLHRRIEFRVILPLLNRSSKRDIPRLGRVERSEYQYQGERERGGRQGGAGSGEQGREQRG